MRFLAFGDVHLGAGASLGREPGDRLRDQAKVLQVIFQLAGERDVDAVLMAGDLFEGPGITPEQLEVFASAVEPFAGEMPIVAINGNGKHDLATREVNALAPLRHVPGVRVFTGPGLYDLGSVQVACLPWVSPARLVAATDGDVDRDRLNDRAAELMVKAAESIADTRIKPTILMLHASLSGASLPQGIATDMLREPVVPVDELLELGFSAVVAGHIHVPQVTSTEEPWVRPTPALSRGEEWMGRLALYTGSPLPLNFGEVDVPHGVWILDVTDADTTAEFVAIPSRPLVQLQFGEGDELEPMDAFEEIPEGAIVKATLRCTQALQRALDVPRLRAMILDAGAHTVKIEVETIREDRRRVDRVTDELEPLDAFDAWAATNATGNHPGLVSQAREQFEHDLEAIT